MKPFHAIVLALVLLGGSSRAGEISDSDRRSGYSFMGPDTRAMQDDDTANPGMLWVLDGEALWNRKEGSAAKSCTDCHGDARTSMKGVAARYPAFSTARGRPVDLEQRINICRAELFPAIAANPFLTFYTVATESGTLSFEWTGDNGFTATESVDITVE